MRKAGRPVTARGPAGRSAAARPVASPSGWVWHVRCAPGRRFPGEPGAWDRDRRVRIVRLSGKPDREGSGARDRERVRETEQSGNGTVPASRFREVRVLYELTEAVARAVDLEEIYELALDGLTEALEVDRASLLLFDPDGVSRFKAWRGLSAEYRAAVEGHSPWPRDARDPQPVLAPDVANAPSLGEMRTAILREGIRALAFIPLVYNGQLLGKFMVYYDEPHVFTDDEVRLARTVASHIAFAIGRKRAEERLRASEEAQAFLAEAGEVLSSTLDARAALRDVARLVVRGFADWCIVYVIEEDGLAHRVAGEHRDPAAQPVLEEYMAHPAAMEPGSPITEVLRSGESRLLSTVDDAVLRAVAGDDPAQVARLRKLGLESGILVPMVARGRTLGSFTLVSTRPGRRYTETDLRVAEDLARRAAFAVDNARLYQEALLANQAKSDFLAVMSHELRTPLTAIMGYAELIRNGVLGEVNEKQAWHLERLLVSARHLLQLIDEILVFTRAEAGREQVRSERVDLANVVNEVGRRIEPLAREKGLEFIVHVPEEPVLIELDRGKVRQVLMSLLSNAVKFTSRGVVELNAELEDGQAVFRVRDTGPGIRPEHIEDIFDPFWQAEQATTRTQGGAGLGLSLARRLARLLGGDITVESTLGEGSTFTVRVPTRRAA